MSGGVRPLYRVVESLIVSAASPGVVADLDALFDRVVDDLYSVEGGTTIRAGKFERHYPGVPVDAGNAQGVVALSGDGPRDVRPVLVAVTGVIDARVIVDKIPAVHVINVGIIVVYTVAGDFSGVLPNVVSEIRGVYVEAGVYYGDNRSRRAGGDVPGPRLPARRCPRQEYRRTC